MIGLYGGAFDPPHRGHVELARSAKAKLGLERLIVTLGPFGGARAHDGGLLLGLAAFCVIVVGLAALRLRRLDL